MKYFDLICAFVAGGLILADFLLGNKGRKKVRNCTIAWVCQLKKVNATNFGMIEAQALDRALSALCGPRLFSWRRMQVCLAAALAILALILIGCPPSRTHISEEFLKHPNYVFVLVAGSVGLMLSISWTKLLLKGAYRYGSKLGTFSVLVYLLAIYVHVATSEASMSLAAVGYSFVHTIGIWGDAPSWEEYWATAIPSYRTLSGIAVAYFQNLDPTRYLQTLVKLHAQSSLLLSCPVPDNPWNILGKPYEFKYLDTLIFLPVPLRVLAAVAFFIAALFRRVLIPTILLFMKRLVESNKGVLSLIAAGLGGIVVIVHAVAKFLES